MVFLFKQKTSYDFTACLFHSPMCIRDRYSSLPLLPSPLLSVLFPSLTDTTFSLQFPHMLIIHAVLEHEVSLEDVARSRRVVAPSGTVLWRLPDRRELAVLWQGTDYRS